MDLGFVDTVKCRGRDQAGVRLQHADWNVRKGCNLDVYGVLCPKLIPRSRETLLALLDLCSGSIVLLRSLFDEDSKILGPTFPKKLYWFLQTWRFMTYSH